MKIPKKMTMEGLRDFTVKNNLYYSHYRNGRVRIYRYRYKYPRDLVGETLVTDYKPIKNFKSMRYGRSHDKQVLRILKKHAKKIAESPGQEKEPDIKITIMPEADEEYETIKKWLEEEE